MLDLNMTSACRYINSLEELGCLEKAPKTKEIRPRLNSLLLCINLTGEAEYLRAIRSVADPVHDEVNISINVNLMIDDTFKHLYHMDSQETLTYSLPDASKDCLRSPAPSKAYLSNFSISVRLGGDYQSIRGKNHPNGPINFKTAAAGQLGAMMERNKS